MRLRVFSITRLRKGDQSVLAVLASLAHLQFQAPAFGSQVRRNWRIPIIAVIDSGYTLLIESLSQSFGRGDTPDSQRLAEIVIIPAIGYGLEITLADCETPHIATNDIIKANPPRNTLERHFWP